MALVSRGCDAFDLAFRVRRADCGEHVASQANRPAERRDSDSASRTATKSSLKAGPTSPEIYVRKKLN